VKNVYIYPISAKIEESVAYNPYIDDFIESMETRFNFVNKGKPSTTGIFDFLKYLFQTDYVFFNWIEDVPDKKGGLAQAIFLLLFLNTSKFLSIKVFWTMHNKLSHSVDHLFLKKMIIKTLLKKPDGIITHSSEGILYAESIVPQCREKIIYLPHPVKNRNSKAGIEKKIDILIWGTISPYKGIAEFLEYLYDKKLQNKYEILVIGKATSKDIFDILLRYANQNIAIKNECPDHYSLQSIISQSRLVVFTYAKSSVLSSGALMDTIGFGANIIGPNVGAFADLEKEGLLRTFNDFTGLILILDEELHKAAEICNDKVMRFLGDNSWFKYAEKIDIFTDL
jgi:hypothetical protein